MTLAPGKWPDFSPLIAFRTMKDFKNHALRFSAPLLFALFGVVCAAFAATFAPGREIARFPASLNEISGMGQSRSNPDIFWVHNDSGDMPRVYAVNRSGKLVGTYRLEGANAEDWEDMAIGPAPGGRSYLYLADIGDNSAQRKSIRVY